ncbi:potassium channel SKOR isoform X3 [Eucalyptus grandis]|uniref:potassium channel SKOR isoform X3 n=1 Tax=Eucalyptus grandis TaxID=71139 RepID=UPI00192ECEB4|nr:potassium channel SKOR isoform X3 [Eucalyptus grandis]
MARGRVENSERGGGSEEEDEREYEVGEVRDRIKSSRGSRFDLLTNELGIAAAARRKFSRESVISGIRDLSRGLVIHPDNRYYRAWKKFILLWAIYSSFFTPLEFGFFRGLPEDLSILDIIGQVAFLFDIVLQFLLAYRDAQTYRMVYKRTPIALRYLKSNFIVDFLGCLPWDIIYKVGGRKEEVRYLLWIRLSRVRKVTEFFQDMEKDIRINYMFTRIVKLIVVELYCTHTAACIFYYLATTLPSSEEGYTWIGSLKLGDYSYSNFRDIDLWKRYLTSLYFAIITMATVGYGDIHAVNLREMIFVMVYVSFDMILGAYLIGNMTALIVKGSKTEKFRDKMTDLIKYMNRNKLGRDIRNQIKGHVRLQYESSYTEAAVIQDIPISIRAKISQTLYMPYVGKVTLFKGCSSDFINQVVTKLHEEFFLPGEVIMEQGNVVDQLYFVCHGQLEEVGIGEDGSEETISLLHPNSSFGQVSILCNIPQPYTVRVLELCRLLRIDKQSLSNILEIYFHDGRKILNNLLEVRESNLRLKQLESDITFHIGKQEAELALRVNSAAFHGDLHQLKSLVRAGADLNKTDYDGRSPLHLAAARGYEDIVFFLVQEGVDVNTKAVARGDSDFLKRILANGIDPNSKDYDHRTPLHVAASEGLYLMAKLLLEAGASVFLKDRWGNTPLDECRKCGNKNLIKLLEAAKSSEMLEFQDGFRETTDKLHSRKCTVYPFHPWDPQEHRRHGVVLWVPDNIEELKRNASEQLNVPSANCVLSEDAGKVLDTDMISEGEKLYLITETQE